MTDKKQSLYERLGGIYAIATVVDDFIDRVMDDPILNANKLVDEAHQRISAAGFKYLVTEFVCAAIGGPQQYSGRTMPDSHEHLKMNNKEWAAFMHDFDQSLYKFQIPAAERDELVAVVESIKPEMGLID